MRWLSERRPGKNVSSLCSDVHFPPHLPITWNLTSSRARVSSKFLLCVAKNSTFNPDYCECFSAARCAKQALNVGNDLRLQPASASIALWQYLGLRRISTYQDPHLGSSLNFSLRIFYEVPQRYNNEGLDTITQKNCVCLRKKKNRPHFKCWGGREKRIIWVSSWITESNPSFLRSYEETD